MNETDDEIDVELLTVFLYDRTRRLLGIYNGIDVDTALRAPWAVMVDEACTETNMHETIEQAETYRMCEFIAQNPLYQDSWKAPSYWELLRHGPIEYRPFRRQARRLSQILDQYADPE